MYPSDGFSVYVALTLSGISGHLPVSAPMLERCPCLQKMPVAEDLRTKGWSDWPRAVESLSAHLHRQFGTCAKIYTMIVVI